MEQLELPMTYTGLTLKLAAHKKAAMDFARHTLQEEPDQDVLALLELLIDGLTDVALGRTP